MNIVSIQASLRNLALSKPYSIAGHYFSEVENVFLEITLANGIVGIGAASPAEEVVGETCAQTLLHCQSAFFEGLVGRDIRYFRQLLDEAKRLFGAFPGTMAALDIALHDAYAQWVGVPVVALYGQKIKALPTSVTIGIMSVADTLAEAKAFEERGFSVLKIKTGEQVEEDIERLAKLRERFPSLTLRVDANQGYDLQTLQTFLKATQHLKLELIEQPLPVGQEHELLKLDETIRKHLAADESLKDARYALRWAQSPQPFGIYNIKLMKCGGIAAALDIATIAQQAQIELFWGCNDESVVSITAALHAAFACPHTRYLDLDGSFDLAQDLVTGGFVLRNGMLSLNDKPGLGVKLI
ncbi:MAG: dipeptide epimerase [Spirosomataceae bacterium]